MAIYVGAATSSFATATSVGIGTTDTTARNAGVGTAIGTLIYNYTTHALEVYANNGTIDTWEIVGSQTAPFEATGGTKSTTSRTGYAVHTFSGSGAFVYSGGPPSGVSAEVYIVGAGGACLLYTSPSPRAS